jgi:ubiquinone/menaquinone biosynthesis C-methylase UbiE
MASAQLLPAGQAFDAVAARFDELFDPWLSVAAQRRAVRRELLAAFPPGASVLEIGGGTGSDACWLAARGRQVFLTDASPEMVGRARRKIGAANAQVLAAEELDRLAESGRAFDGAFSNFAALNCVGDLAPVGRSLARLVRPGGMALLVVFGCLSPGEIATEALRGRFAKCLRRRQRGDVKATLKGREFTVRYHRREDIERALAPWFRLRSRKAVGLFVPPSAAEPWISRHPRLLRAMEAADGVLSRRLPQLGDHVLYAFERQPGARP